ncbi:MAG: NYN domain-containing protein [Candidatus Paceibacterota bacterium]
MKRFAFIDVPNTTGTTRECLDFHISWERLYSFLTNEKWNCEMVFFYKGYKGYKGEKEKEQLLEKLGKDIGYEVRTKPTHIHPDKEKDLIVKCDSCGVDFIHKYIINGNQKSNCDVELTVDALNVLKEGDEALIFTGDGDFSYLIRNLLEKKNTVLIVSSQKRNKRGDRRFSTRLRSILREEGQESKRVRFLEINRWKANIESS